MSEKPSTQWSRFWGESGGLSVIVVCSILMLPLALLTSGALRIVFSLVFVLFFPGYTLISALFPAKGRLDGIERLALSFGLSLAVVPLIGLVLNFTPWGIRFEPILFSLFGFIIVTAAAAFYRRSRLLPGERFTADLRAPLNSIAAGWAGKKVWDKVLTIILLAAIAGTIGTTVYIVGSPGASEKFTEFYILGPGGKAADYPRQMILGTSAGVIAGVVNHEGENVTYRIEIAMNGTSLGRVGNITLADEGKWEGPVSFNAAVAGDNQSVQFLLFRDANATAYRSLHLWLDVLEK